MNKPLEIKGGLIARNTLLNLIGQGLPLVVAVVTMPFIIQGLGIERFGLLALAWVVLGYFAIFDLGLGRATTKFVAEALGKGEEEQVPRLVWTAVTIQAFFGLLGAIVLASITPLLVERILNIPPELIKEAKDTFYLLSLSIPVVLVSSSFRGVLEAFQRFDLVNIVQVPSSTLTFLLPLVGLLLGFNLPGIVSLILVARFAELAVFVVMSIRSAPPLKRYSGTFTLLPRLFSFGGWVTISSIVIPIFVFLDRFIIGSLLTLSAVAYYTAPHAIISRLGILPASLVMTLFPAFSTLAARRSQPELNAIAARSIKYLVMVEMVPTVLFLLFAEDILMIWLGSNFAAESTSVFRLLAIAFLLNAIGHIPFALIQGIGRPDVVAKYHLIELPLYVGVVFFLVWELGITGAALAWCLRMGWTIPIFSLLCIKIAGVPLKAFSENGTNRSLIVAAGVLIPSIALVLLREWGIVATGLLAGAILVGYLLLSWFIVFDQTDRDFAKSFILQTYSYIIRCCVIRGA
ncbi:flippase [Thermodesulfovibrionales bacterium]|nr:flippase [Thermodesulfovibrionales bacterium]